MDSLLRLEVWQLAIVGLVAALGLGLAALNFRSGILFMAVMLFASSIATQLSWNMLLVRTIITQVQNNRSVMYLAAGGLLLLTAVFHVQRVRWRAIPGPSIAFLCIGLYAGMIRMLAQDFAEGAQSVMFALFTMIPLAIYPVSYVRDWWDMYILPRMIGMVGMVWCVLCLLQFVVNRKALTTGFLTQRFVGMLSNPQHAGAFLAFTVIACVFLTLNDPKRTYRALWMCTAAVSGVLLLWTASRTALGMAAIGVAACFYGRLGTGVILLPIIGGLGLFAYDFLAGQRVDFDLARLTLSSETREGAWRKLISDFQQEPFFGKGGTSAVGSGARAEKSENSLLYGMASYGVGMGLLIIVFAIVSALQCLKLIRLRGSLAGYQRRWVEFLLGMQGAFWAGSVFEGYIVGRVGAPIIFMMLTSALSYRAIELTNQEQAGELPADAQNTEGMEHVGTDGYGDYEQQPATA